MRSGLGAAVNSWPGKIPTFWWLLRARRLRAYPRHWMIERSESAAARKAWGTIPRAEVATIIPTYRRPQQLLAAVESALAQTVTDQVVVVVDDGAGLPRLPDHPRLFSHSLGVNCGAAGVVRNVGIRATDSRYLAFLDDDNIWRPEHLAVALEPLRADEADLVYTALARQRHDGSEVDVMSVPFSRQAMKRQGFTDTNTIVVRRGRGVRFDKVRRRHGEFPSEDWSLVNRLSRRLRVKHLPAVTVDYLVHDDSFYTNWQS
ncbi:MAG: glycosyltransferase family 2 protein [Actinomycetia bacterium]|nr:glycosyltransferase family 2 protein [Actinomycetes bacterium]